MARTHVSIALLGVAMVIGVSAIWVYRQCVPAATRGAPDGGGLVEYSGAMGKMPSSSVGKRVIVMGDELTVGAYVGTDGITIESREVLPGQGPSSFVSAGYFFATSFQVVDVAGRQSSEVFVLGAENVIERWTQEIMTGSRYLTVRNTTVAPGVPVPDIEQGIKGGTWLPLDQRPKELRQRRNVVLGRFSGPEFCTVHVDPEGRYLLLVTKDNHDVFQLALTVDAAPVQIASSSQTVQLPQYTGGHLAHHETRGRLFIMERVLSSGGIDRVILSDLGNDGVFESMEALSAADWTAQGMDGQVWFRPDFFDYSAN